MQFVQVKAAHFPQTSQSAVRLGLRRREDIRSRRVRRGLGRSGGGGCSRCSSSRNICGGGRRRKIGGSGNSSCGRGRRRLGVARSAAVGGDVPVAVVVFFPPLFFDMLIVCGSDERMGVFVACHCPLRLRCVPPDGGFDPASRARALRRSLARSLFRYFDVEKLPRSAPPPPPVRQLRYLGKRLDVIHSLSRCTLIHALNGASKRGVWDRDAESAAPSFPSSLVLAATSPQTEGIQEQEGEKGGGEGVLEGGRRRQERRRRQRWRLLIV